MKTGATPILTRLTKNEIRPDEVIASVAHRGAGGVVLFLGTVRDMNEGAKVVGIQYEAYEAMAESGLSAIAESVAARWPVKRVAIVHRTGPLKVGDVSVAVAVAAPHRAEAFEACRYAIDRVKREVPIWKKEKFVNGGEQWVLGQPVRRRGPRRG